MKRILSVLLIMTLMVVCSNFLGGPLEKRVLGEQVLNSVAGESNEILHGHEISRISSREKFHIAWPPSHGKSRWGYSFWYDSESKNGEILMEEFRSQILHALERVGATILKQEDFEQSEFPFGFKFEYEKSKVVGEVSIRYKVWSTGSHLFEVSQLEIQ